MMISPFDLQLVYEFMERHAAAEVDGSAIEQQNELEDLLQAR